MPQNCCIILDDNVSRLIFSLDNKLAPNLSNYKYIFFTYAVTYEDSISKWVQDGLVCQYVFPLKCFEDIA